MHAIIYCRLYCPTFVCLVHDLIVAFIFVFILCLLSIVCGLVPGKRIARVYWMVFLFVMSIARYNVYAETFFPAI